MKYFTTLIIIVLFSIPSIAQNKSESIIDKIPSIKLEDLYLERFVDTEGSINMRNKKHFNYIHLSCGYRIDKFACNLPQLRLYVSGVEACYANREEQNSNKPKRPFNYLAAIYSSYN